MPKKSWTIRKAKISDAEALTSCMQAAYNIYLSRLDGVALPPMIVDYEEEIRSYPVWIAESDKLLIGGLILMAEDKYMTIANIAVHPEFQGNGLGRGLMEFGEKQAKQKGYSEVRLATHILLTENLSLYTHFGWSEIGRDESRIFMKKDISKQPMIAE